RLDRGETQFRSTACLPQAGYPVRSLQRALEASSYIHLASCSRCCACLEWDTLSHNTAEQRAGSSVALAISERGLRSSIRGNRSKAGSPHLGSFPFARISLGKGRPASSRDACGVPRAADSRMQGYRLEWEDDISHLFLLTQRRTPSFVRDR